MTDIRKILYATDFSESSVSALDYALSLAKLAGAKLHIIHVIGELVEKQRTLIPHEAFDIMQKEVHRNALKEMEKFCKTITSDVDYTTEEVVGFPFEEIIRKAEGVKADLIVIGTHGRTGIKHVVLGSTVERVVRRSQIPVLTVRSRS